MHETGVCVGMYVFVKKLAGTTTLNLNLNNFDRQAPLLHQLKYEITLTLKLKLLEQTVYTSKGIYNILHHQLIQC